MFQSYLFVSREAHKWMITAFDFEIFKDDKNDKVVSAEEFLSELKNIDNKANCKNIKEIDFSYPKINKYWFWRLDYYIWEGRKTIFKNNKESLKVAEDYIFRKNRSIEHVAPQNPENNSKIEIREKEGLHSFGNLAMISSSQNSSLKNKSFEMKKAHVEAFINESKTGSIESLKLLKIYEYENWNEEAINKHGKEMIELLQKSLKE